MTTIRIEYDDNLIDVVDRVAEAVEPFGVKIENVPGDKDGFELYTVEKTSESVNEEMLAAITEFCERVEKGEVRSRYTYAKFKNIIAKTQG
jgi:hypothetical protein